MACQGTTTIVLDTSTLLNFVNIGRIESLGQLGASILLPDQVLDEARRPGQRKTELPNGAKCITPVGIARPRASGPRLPHSLCCFHRLRRRPHKTRFRWLRRVSRHPSRNRLSGDTRIASVFSSACSRRQPLSRRKLVAFFPTLLALSKKCVILRTWQPRRKIPISAPGYSPG